MPDLRKLNFMRKKTIQFRDNDSLSREDATFLKHFFDADFYLTVNDDVKQAGVDPFAHFCVNGFGENRNPSRLVDQTYFPFLVEYNGGFPASKPQAVGELVALLRKWSVDSVFGPSALFCPQWLALQLGLDSKSTLADVVTATVPPGSFSLHPGLSPMQIAKPVKVAQIFAAQRTDDFASYSLVDLSGYVANHRDLGSLKDHPEAAFSHLWTSGLHQNRLKYLGNRRPSNVPMDRVLLSQLATVYHGHLMRPSLLSPMNPQQLQARNLTYPTGSDPLLAALNHMQDQAHPSSAAPFSLDDVLALQSLHSSDKTVVMPAAFQSRAALAAVPNRLVGSKILTDRALMSGAYPVTTKRVVYGVNIGAYDDLPIPPEMDDCSYFLITDAAEVPSNSPWVIVSPTLQEVDIKRQCLWYKTHPHKLFPNVEFVTWIDSNIECRTQSGQVLISHETLSEIATFVHPDRNCVYEEASAITNIKLDKQHIVDRVVQELQDEGFPKAYGLYETNVLFSRTQDLAVRDFFDTWWRRIYLGSRRDQMSFTYAAWKEGVAISALDSRFCAKDSRFFFKNSHKNKEGRFV